MVHSAPNLPSIELFKNGAKSITVGFADRVAVVVEVFRNDLTALVVLGSLADDLISQKRIVLFYLLGKSPIGPIVALAGKDVLVVLATPGNDLDLSLANLFRPFIPGCANRPMRVQGRGLFHHVENAPVSVCPHVVGAVKVVTMLDKIKVGFVGKVVKLCLKIAKPITVPALVGVAGFTLRVSSVKRLASRDLNPKRFSSFKVKEIGSFRGSVCEPRLGWLCENKGSDYGW